MAPNNALSQKKVATVSTAATTSIGPSSASSVLGTGIVESRGHGSTTTADAIHQDIRIFLDGEGKFSLACESRCFFTVWTFLTRLPGPTFADHHPGYLMLGMVYFPIVGTVIGIWIHTFYEVSLITFGLPPIIASAIATASSLWLTGCFHEDGLGDTSDGFGGGWSRSQILTIMTDTRLGTYGCVVLVLYILTKLELYSELGKRQQQQTTSSSFSSDIVVPVVGMTSMAAIITSQTISRLVAVYMIKTNTYIDESDGPKTQYYSFMVSAKHLISTSRLMIAIVYCFAITSIFYNTSIAVCLIVTVLFCGHCAGRYSSYILGGIVGDFLGATICIVELIVLCCIIMIEPTTNFVNDTSKILIESIQNYNMSNRTVNDMLQTLFQELYQDERYQVLLKFIGMILCCIVWSRNVGHPDVLVRDVVVKNLETNNGKDNDNDINIGLQRSTDASNTTNESLPSSSTKTAMDPSSSRFLAEEALKKPNATFKERYNAVRTYLDTLAKPVGSLGTLEDWAARIGASQRTTVPVLDTVSCLLFAADHGMAADCNNGGEHCSAYPQSVTRSILNGLERGIAGASVLAHANHIDLRVIDVGVLGTSSHVANKIKTNGKVINSTVDVVESKYKLQSGTKNACVEPAMSMEECNGCIQAGREAVLQCLESGRKTKLFVFGEVGIGNTTTSSLLLAALTGTTDIASLCDGGATTERVVDDDVIQKKIKIVQKALSNNSNNNTNTTDTSTSTSTKMTPMEILARYGGAEITALVGAILQSATNEIIVVIDGYIVTVAAAFAVQIQPTCCQYMILSSRSTEKGYNTALQLIQNCNTTSGTMKEEEEELVVPIKPALDMSLRMGEGSAGLLVIPLIRNAVDILHKMATIDQILSNDDEDESPN